MDKPGNPAASPDRRLNQNEFTWNHIIRVRGMSRYASPHNSGNNKFIEIPY